MPAAIVEESPLPWASSTRTGMIDRPVREAGEPEVVVGGLGDLSGDERAVALTVERVGVGAAAVAIVPATRSHGSTNFVPRKSGDRLKLRQLRNATPVSTTAITTPLAPGR